MLVPQLGEEMAMKQGIVSILGSDCERNKTASIRRTLSADMSSKKWLQQNGIVCSRVKKIGSFEELMAVADHDSSSFSSSSSESEGECENFRTQDEIWRSIQCQAQEMEKPVEKDVWGTIIAQKSENFASSSPPYIHPQVKRSASCMSEKSLQICTEGLGSETGSDDFIIGSEFSSEDDNTEERQRESIYELNLFEKMHVVKYKKAPVCPIPPPLSSVSGGDGASVRIHSHRRDGRLVLEAIAVPPKKYLHAERRDGRLVLTLINAPFSTCQEVDNKEEAVESVAETKGGGGGNDTVVDEKLKVSTTALQVDLLMEHSFKSLPSKMIRVDKKSVVAKKRFVGTNNTNPLWSHKFNSAMKMMDEELPMSNSLPPLPPMARHIPQPPQPSVACSFNVYEYYWRTKTTIPKIPTTPQATFLKNKSPDSKLYDQNQHKTEYFVSKLRGCHKEPRSLPIWEACCIATS